MAELDLDQLLEQRAEATGTTDEGYVSFGFTARAGDHKGEKLTFRFRDSMYLDDDDWDELREIQEDDDANVTDIVGFWMGEEELERFFEAGGKPRMIVAIIQEKAEREAAEDEAGKSGRPNRSQRRAAGRKRSKQR